MIARATVCCILVLLAFPALGQETWTLEHCLQITKAHSLTLKKADADVASSRGSCTSSWSGILPHISAYTDATRYSSEQMSFVQDSVRTSKNRYSAGLRLNQTFFNGGSSWAQLSSAKASLRAAEQSCQATKAQLALNVAETFYSVLRAEALADVAREAELLARRQLERAEERHRMGAASRQEVLKAKVELHRDMLAKMRQENELATAKSSLLLLLGKEPGTEYILVPPAEQGIDVPPLEECMAKGQQHPSILAYVEQLTSTHKSVTMAAAGRYPSLTGSASYGWSDVEIPDDVDRFKDADSWSVGLTLSMYLFDGLETKGAVQRAKASARDAELTLREMQLSQRHTVEDSHRRLLEAKAQSETADAALALANEEYRLAEERYGMGSLSFLELSDSKLALQRAKVDQVEAKNSVNVARSTLDEATGELGDLW